MSELLLSVFAGSESAAGALRDLHAGRLAVDSFASAATVSVQTTRVQRSSTDVGSDAATPVDDSTGGHRFTGRVRWVQIDIDEAAEDLDHLVRPEERTRVAMARQ